MSVNINDILQELYALDPDLRQKESEIQKIIERMIKNRPEIQIDESFRNELRHKIMLEIEREMSRQNAPKYWWSWMPVAGALSLCLIAGVWIINGRESANSATLLSFQNTVREVGQEWLGTIELAPQAQTAARPQSGGGGGSLGNADAVSSKMMAPDAMIYPPIDMPVYNYTYEGKIELPESELPVYRKENIPFNSSDTRSIVRNLALRDIDTGAFENLGLSNLTLTEDRDYGYMLNIDFLNGTINMYQNYLKWPQPVCDQNGCTPLPKLTESDIPADSVIIAESQKFIQKYRIDMSAYGAPQVDSSWRIWYARSAEMGGEQMIPDMYTVTYPLLLDGKTIYQEGGSYRGLTLNYHIRTKRITGLYGIEKSTLNRSSYKTIQDLTLIQDMIKNGGRYINTDTSANAGRKVVNISLGEPTLGYAHIFGEWKNGKTTEYLVPAYIFPVKNPPKEGYAPSTIIIPLIESFVQKVQIGPMDPIIYSTEPAVGPAVKE